MNSFNKMQAYVLGDWDFNPPPAAPAALAKPKEIIVLAQTFVRAYPKVGQRIA